MATHRAHFLLCELLLRHFEHLHHIPACVQACARASMPVCACALCARTCVRARTRACGLAGARIRHFVLQRVDDRKCNVLHHNEILAPTLLLRLAAVYKHMCILGPEGSRRLECNDKGLFLRAHMHVHACTRVHVCVHVHSCMQSCTRVCTHGAACEPANSVVHDDVQPCAIPRRVSVSACEWVRACVRA